MSKRWKATERTVAKILHGVRVPITGRQRGDVPDVEHPFFSIEVKDRQSLPSWLMDAMNQADASIRGDKIPIVVLHQKGIQNNKNLAIMRLGNVSEMYKKIESLEHQVEALQDDIRAIREVRNDYEM